MPMPQFHQTMYGKRFFELDVPQMVGSLHEISKQLTHANSLKEEELKIRKREIEQREQLIDLLKSK